MIICCDAMRQKESEVVKIQFLIFYVIVLYIFNATFSRKPRKNWFAISGDTSD